MKITRVQTSDPTSTTILRDVSTGVALPDLTWIGAPGRGARTERAGRPVSLGRRVRSAMARASRKHVRRPNDF